VEPRLLDRWVLSFFWAVVRFKEGRLHEIGDFAFLLLQQLFHSLVHHGLTCHLFLFLPCFCDKFKGLHP